MKLNQIKKVQQNIEKGGWMSDLPNLPGVSVKVRGLFNSEASKNFADARATMTEEEFKDPDIQDALDVRLLAETILVDWDGIDGDDGEPLEFSQELAEQILSDPDMEVFRRAVTHAASVVAQRGKDTLETAEKN
jgi:hypothetical protein